MTESLTTLFKDPHDLLRELVQDVIDGGRRINESDNPSERRDFIRALFAVVDGLTYALKKYTLLFAVSNNVRFELQERCLLVDQSFDLNDNGTVRTRQRYLSTSKNLIFTACCFVKASGIDYSLDLQSDGWMAFRNAIDVRNRITHPKVGGDLVVSDSELAAAKQAAAWVLALHAKLLELTLAKHTPRQR